MKYLFRNFGLAVALSIIGLVCALLLGPAAVAVALILAAIEIAFSFDNAVINARVLKHLGPFWQKLFLSLGIVIAVFGVRFLLPLVIVCLTTHLSFGNVFNLALRHPAVYAQSLNKARPAITAFGGAFLLVLALHFFTTDREVRWLEVIEKPLGRFVGRRMPIIVTALVVVALSLLPTNHHKLVTFEAGIIGLLTYAFLSWFIELIELLFGDTTTTKRVGMAALVTFLYLQLLDASLSFDSVIGAFAITSNIFLIAIGLGIGAVWVRSLTVHMVRAELLTVYRYLEHGAHYAIALLAVAMLLGPIVVVPDYATGLLCVAVIGASFTSSHRARKVSA